MKPFGVGLVILVYLGVVSPALADGLPPAPNGDLTYGDCPAPTNTGKADGATGLSFDGTQDGALTHVTVRWSSANPDLDRAAQSCISQWHFSPNTKRGQRYLGYHSVSMFWTKPKDSDHPHGELMFSHSCFLFPEMARLGDVSGEVMIGFTISEEGDVTDASVVKSSGNADLDKGALHCVESWFYRPALKDGKPVAVPFKANVVWNVTPPPSGE